MFFDRRANKEARQTVDALHVSQAVIEFDMNGVILTANDNFLEVMGYSLSEIVGKHHSLFVDDAERSSGDYRTFWSQLNAGKFQTAQFKRIRRIINVV